MSRPMLPTPPPPDSTPETSAPGLEAAKGIEVFQELELKLTSDQPIDGEAVAARLREQVQVGEGAIVEQRDAYLDTPGRMLAKAGLAARCRQKRGESRLQLKAVPIDPELIAERTEIAAEVPAGRTPGEAVQGLIERLFPLSLDAVPVPTVELVTQRHAFEVHGAKFRAELCIDHVVATNPSGEGRAEFHELELEFAEGDVDEFRACAAGIGQMFGLKASDETKYLHALRLLGLPGYRYPASRLTLTPEMTTARGGRLLLRHQFKKMLTYETGTRVGLDPEQLHKMRVASRRIRSALRVFRDAFEVEQYKILAREFRWLARELGRVRDLDVQQLSARAWRRDLGKEPAAGWVALDAALRRRWRRARRRLLSKLASRRYRALIEFAALAFDPEGSVPSTDASRVPVVETGDVVLEGLRDRFREGLALALRTREAEDIHDLRIEGKALRYGREMFKSVLSEDVIASIGPLKRFQDALGEIQDAAQAVAVAEDLLRKARKGHEPDEAYVEVLERIRTANEAKVAEGPAVVTASVDRLAPMDRGEASP